MTLKIGGSNPLSHPKLNKRGSRKEKRWIKKGGRFTDPKIRVINQAVQKKIGPWARANLEPPPLLVAEIARETGLPPISIVKNLFSPDSIATPVGTNGKNPQQWLQETQTPRPSKKADRIRGEIWTEGQRYQRRSQFPVSPRPKTTQKKINSQVRNWQLERTRLQVKPPAEEAETERQKTKARVAQRWQRKILPEEAVSRSEAFAAQEKADKLMSSVRSFSVMSPERPERIKELLVDAALKENSLVIANWICPMGTPLAFDEPTQRLFRRYALTDPEEGFNRDYQLLPRLDLEKRLIRTFERFEIPFLYLKIVADDNPYCLYPACFRIDGEQETMAAIKKNSQYTQERFDQLLGPNKIWVLTWSELLGPELFDDYLRVYDNTSLDDLLPYLPQDAVNTMVEILTDHTRPDPQVLPRFERFATDCIRYFAVEGWFLDKIFDDSVVLAWNDSTRIGRTIDALRLAKRLPALPKIYTLHGKKGGRIIDDF